MAELQGLPLQGDDDAVVIANVRAGDSSAFGVIVARYRTQFGRYAVRMLGNREDAEEALQDAFVRAFRSLETCEDPAKFGSWFFRILANRCRTAGARRGRRDRTFVRDEIALTDASEEHPAERDAWREEIERALKLLDDDQREAFLLKHVEELGYEEMSELTGVGVSALKMRVKRACERLRSMLQEVQGV
ncbi:MAG TPA: RNA polymerase sigma factor [Gemmatimonadaceae bacterium]|jgi:RNA polymerase sigma-70 factor (ECF subfamily)|nr:RNA polymerase sigma factor [Gemmatimonadaceae bacterium]